MQEPGKPMSEAIQHPGAVLGERYLQPLGIAPSQLAKSIGVPIDQVSELIGGRRPIDPDMAARLALFFDVPPQWWLLHQARYDAAYLAPLEALRGVVTPYEKLSNVLVTPHGVTHLAPLEAPSTETARATFSPAFLARLRTQAEWAEENPRTVFETTYADGTTALEGR